MHHWKGNVSVSQCVKASPKGAEAHSALFVNEIARKPPREFSQNIFDECNMGRGRTN